jgi:hypothetical protein
MKTCYAGKWHGRRQSSIRERPAAGMERICAFLPCRVTSGALAGRQAGAHWGAKVPSRQSASIRLTGCGPFAFDFATLRFYLNMKAVLLPLIPL